MAKYECAFQKKHTDKNGFACTLKLHTNYGPTGMECMKEICPLYQLWQHTVGGGKNG